MFSLLRSSRRRWLLRTLDRCPSPLEFETLVDRLAAHEAGVGPSSVDRDDRAAVYASTHQTHLPTLEEAGVLEYDRAERTVSITDRGKWLARYTARAPGIGRQWDRLVLALAVSWFAAFVVIGALGTISISDPRIAMACVGTFLLVSLGYLRDASRHARAIPHEWCG